MKIIAATFLLFVIFSSCKTRQFGKKSFHEQYAEKLSGAGLQDAALGRLWFGAAGEALHAPVTVSIPIRQVGYFSAAKPIAVGLSFQAKRGQKLLFNVKKNPSAGFVLFNELWRNDGGTPKLQLAVDTAKNAFEFEVEESGTYILRMQPELLQSGEYDLSISIAPSLRFPVAGTAKIGSFWGAPRDGGARSHEGIDIFAAKRTPVVATSDGTVYRVTENEIGGKVLFLRPEGKNISVYYAHLDEQLVTAGKRVKAGDTLGLVGNTGNARTTPPHLHFGIYTSGGAIDPIDFVNPAIKKPATLNSSAMNIAGVHRLTKTVTQRGLELQKNMPVEIYARNTGFDWVKLPDGKMMQLPPDLIHKADRPLETFLAKDSLSLHEQPGTNSPRMKFINRGEKVQVFGMYRTFAWVKSGDEAGWIDWSLVR